jgi:CheY-like chemotaxis protein
MALSAYVNKEIKDKCRQSGFNEVVSKPLDENELLMKIHDLIREKPEKSVIQENSYGKSRIDLSPLEKIADNDPVFIEKMLSIYLDNLDESIQIFEKNNFPDQIKKIQYAAHKLIPSSRHMGMEELVNKLKKLERYEPDEGNTPEGKTLYLEILENLKQIRKNLNTQIQNV